MKVSTKVNEKAVSVETELTLDFTGTSREDLEKQATKSIVIAWQGDQRALGVIPAKATVKVAEFLKQARVRGTPLTADSASTYIGGITDRATYEKSLAAIGVEAKEIKRMADTKFKGLTPPAK